MLGRGLLNTLHELGVGGEQAQGLLELLPDLAELIGSKRVLDAKFAGQRQTELLLAARGIWVYLFFI